MRANAACSCCRISSKGSECSRRHISLADTAGAPPPALPAAADVDAAAMEGSVEKRAPGVEEVWRKEEKA